jgi:hypothetical protein
MKRLQLLVLGALVLAALSLSSTASAAIVPQHSIAGAKLGMTRTQVEAKLGAPNRVKFHKSVALGFSWRDLFYPRVTVSVFALESGEKVVTLTTKSKLERTASGVGVASTLAQLRSGLNGETCRRELGIHHCWIGRWKPGKVVSDFFLVHGLVSKITIGYVLD